MNLKNYLILNGNTRIIFKEGKGVYLSDVLILKNGIPL